MGKYCLVKPFADDFKQRLKNGEIDPEKLASMTSKERNTFFTEFLGEHNAKNVNALFEKKLLMKNKWQGVINWAKEVSGIKPEVRNDLLSRIERMAKDPEKNILNPENETAFLKDLASSKVGVGISYDEAKNITEMANKVNETKNNYTEKDGWTSESDRLKYGAAKMTLKNYVNDLKIEASKPELKEYLNPGKSISLMAGYAKSLKASLDDSALFRQGWKTVFTNPKIWGNNALKSFNDIAKVMGGKDIITATEAEIYSRPNSMNGLYNKLKIDIGNLEEAYPTTLPEKIPLFGRLFKASEQAYTAFLYRMRADIADKYIKIAQKTGVDLGDDFQSRSIGRIINSLTGRGDLGSFEKAGKAVNNIFFSPKLLKSHIDVLTLHYADNLRGQKTSGFARKKAAMNLLKVITGIATILAVAKALDDKSVELDPRSSDFGKIRIGDTRFDVSGGMSSVVVLASRLIAQSSKSSTTGNISKLGTGFGQTSGIDLVENFLENKLSPAASVIKDLFNKSDWQGNPLTIGGEISNLLMPLPLSTGWELYTNPNSANIVLSMIADGLGISVNTYSLQSNWNKDIGAELQQLKDKIGQEEFNKANNQYNLKIQQNLKSLKNTDEFKKLSEEDKQKEITKMKSDAKQDIFSDYNFKYKKPKKSSSLPRRPQKLG